MQCYDKSMNVRRGGHRLSVTTGCDIGVIHVRSDDLTLAVSSHLAARGGSFERAVFLGSLFVPLLKGFGSLPEVVAVAPGSCCGTFGKSLEDLPCLLLTG